MNGTVRAGVEPNCLVLDAGGKEYLLLGGDRDVVRVGAKVVVHGRPTPGQPTTCMQGTPLHVIDAETQAFPT